MEGGVFKSVGDVCIKSGTFHPDPGSILKDFSLPSTKKLKITIIYDLILIFYESNVCLQLNNCAY